MFARRTKTQSRFAATSDIENSAYDTRVTARNVGSRQSTVRQQPVFARCPFLWATAISPCRSLRRRPIPPRVRTDEASSDVSFSKPLPSAYGHTAVRSNPANCAAAPSAGGANRSPARRRRTPDTRGCAPTDALVADRAMCPSRNPPAMVQTFRNSSTAPETPNLPRSVRTALKRLLFTVPSGQSSVAATSRID